MSSAILSAWKNLEKRSKFAAWMFVYGFVLLLLWLLSYALAVTVAWPTADATGSVCFFGAAVVCLTWAFMTRGQLQVEERQRSAIQQAREEGARSARESYRCPTCDSPGKKIEEA